MKVLLWILVALAVAMWLIHGKKKQVNASRNHPASRQDATSEGNPETMVRCEHCGIYTPVSESVVAPTGMTFCSEEHRLRHSSPDSRA